MQREFTSNLVILLLLNLIIKPFYIFGIEAQVQNKVANYGLYFGVFGFVFLHQWINDPGIQNFNTLYIASNRDQLKSYFSKLIGLKVVLYLIMVGIALINAYLVGYLPDHLWLILSITFFFVLSTWFVLFRSSLSALGYYKIDSYLSSLDRLILIVVLGFALWWHKSIDLKIFVGIQCMVYIICTGVVLFILNQKGYSILPKFDTTFIKDYLKKSMPFALIILLTAIVMRIDGVMIERLRPDGIKEAGIYAAGYRFLDLANMFGYLFGGLLLPMYSNKLDVPSEINKIYVLAFKILSLSACVLASLLYFHADSIVALFYDFDLSMHLDTLKIMFLAIVPLTMTNVFGPLLLAQHKVKGYNISMAIVAIVMTIGNFIFLPKYGIIATAMINAICWTLVLLSMIILVYKYGGIALANPLFLTWFINVVSIVVIFYTSCFMPYHWLINVGLALLSSLIITFLLKTIPLKEMGL